MAFDQPTKPDPQLNRPTQGSSLHEGWTKSIPAEWREDVPKPPVPTTVIVDGGGNDVISVRSDCEAFNGNCARQIDEAVSIAADLLEQMHSEGACVCACVPQPACVRRRVD